MNSSSKACNTFTITSINPAQNKGSNLIFGVKFRGFQSNILLKEHLYSLFLLLLRQGQQKHKIQAIRKIQMCKQKFRLGKTDILSKLSVDQQFLMQVFDFVQAAIRNVNNTSQLHTQSQRKMIRACFWAMFELQGGLAPESLLSVAQSSLLAGMLIGAQVKIKQYFDFQVIEFSEASFQEKQVQVFIQISKSGKEFRYIKKKCTKQIKNKMLSSKDSYGIDIRQKYDQQQSIYKPFSDLSGSEQAYSQAQESIVYQSKNEYSSPLESVQQVLDKQVKESECIAESLTSTIKNRQNQSLLISSKVAKKQLACAGQNNVKKNEIHENVNNFIQKKSSEHLINAESQKKYGSYQIEKISEDCKQTKKMNAIVQKHVGQTKLGSFRQNQNQGLDQCIKGLKNNVIQQLDEPIEVKQKIMTGKLSESISMPQSRSIKKQNSLFKTFDSAQKTPQPKIQQTGRKPSKYIQVNEKSMNGYQNSGRSSFSARSNKQLNYKMCIQTKQSNRVKSNSANRNIKSDCNCSDLQNRRKLQISLDRLGKNTMIIYL